MSDTPRTDEHERMMRTEVDDPTAGLIVRDEAVVHADVARELERDLAAERATTASLLRALALIREAGGWKTQMLSELPGAVKALREQRDEARREVCEAEVMLSPRDDLRRHEYAAERGWDCYGEGGGA